MALVVNDRVTDAATDTLARTTLISSSTGSAVDFAAGTKDVFCTLPASVAVFGKQEGTDFADSLLVGHSTTGTLSGTPGPVKNTGVGIDALNSITTGYNNTCVGFSAGTALTTGQQNTLIGDRCGDAIVGANNNVGVGVYALTDNTAANNTAVGYNSGNQNNSGTNNTSLGKEALKGVHGNSHSYNTAIGSDSNENVTTGGYNLTLGYQSGDNITTGSGNVVLGNADVSSATGDDQLVIADGEDGSVVWMTGDSSGNVVFAGTATANGSLLATQGDATALAVALG